MTVKSSGSLGLVRDIVGEFGGTAPHRITEYYKGGGNVPNISQNTNIPTSGRVRFSQYYNGLNEITVYVNSNAENLVLQNLFNSTIWSSSVPKKVVINAMVGGTSTGTAAVRTGTGWGGTLKLVNEGSIRGAGGAAGGGTGGDALHIQQNGLILINNGDIKGGGGGGGNGGAGGRGGTGGGGRYSTSSSSSSSTRYTGSRIQKNDNTHVGGGMYTRFTQSTMMKNEGSGTCSGQVVVIWGDYQPMVPCTTKFSNVGPGGKTGYNQCHARPYFIWDWDYTCVSTVTTTTTTNTNGGAGGSGGTGGSGGRGEGYNQSRTNGSSGSGGSGGANGGTNAGRGGTGGTGGSGGNGGSYGASGGGGSNGNTGASGANGNRTNGTGGSGGSSGSGGGVAGFSIRNRNYATSYTNNGTVLGRI